MREERKQFTRPGLPAVCKNNCISRPFTFINQLQFILVLLLILLSKLLMKIQNQSNGSRVPLEMLVSILCFCNNSCLWSAFYLQKHIHCTSHKLQKSFDITNFLHEARQKSCHASFQLLFPFLLQFSLLVHESQTFLLSGSSPFSLFAEYNLFL